MNPIPFFTTAGKIIQRASPVIAKGFDKAKQWLGRQAEKKQPQQREQKQPSTQPKDKPQQERQVSGQAKDKEQSDTTTLNQQTRERAMQEGDKLREQGLSEGDGYNSAPKNESGGDVPYQAREIQRDKPLPDTDPPSPSPTPGMGQGKGRGMDL